MKKSNFPKKDYIFTKLKSVAPNPIKMKYFEAEIASFGKTFEERLEKLREIGKQASADFKSEYTTIHDWFTRYDQLSILSFSFYYFMLSEVGYDEEAVTGNIEFPPYYLELLQAFALTLPRSYDYQPFSNEVYKFKEDFQKIGLLNQMKYYNLPKEVATIQDVFSHQLRSDMMLHTTVVRNWSYEHKMRTVTEALALGVKETFNKIHGFDPCLFLNILYRMSEEVEKRVNIHRQKTVKMIKATNYNDIFDIYEAAFPVNKTSTKEREMILSMSGMDQTKLKSMFLMHSDMFLQKLLSFNFSTISKLSENEISEEKLQEIFENISYSFGDLDQHDPEHFLLSNPVHAKPFIKIDKKTIFSSMWSIMTHLSIGLLENYCSENEYLRIKYNEVRAEYLEKKVSELFKSSFPMAEIHAGSKWKGKDGKIYENDLLVIIDSFAIVVEAKSGQISAPAKRGAPARLFKTLQELIEEPSEQALRFIEYLKENPRIHSLQVKKGKNNIINAEKIKYFIPLGVTLTHLGTMGSNLKEMISAGVIKRKIEELAPSINLTDLECVFDLLPLASQKIHYLQRRREIEADINYSGHELDLLAWYLNEGFNLGIDLDKYGYFNLSSKSKELDNYFIGSSNNEDVLKPELQMTQWWKDILERAESKKFQQWMETSYIMLNIPISGQKLFEEDVNSLKEKILTGKAEFPHNYILMGSQDEKRRFYVVGYCYQDIYYDERNDVMNNILDMEATKDAKGMLVISMNIDKKHYPYSILGSHLSSELFDNKYLSMISANK
ncbi:hypothetical protein [Flavobacterium sp.]|uniref:hypothetical protein n=1 Tax=Flavobacterium sp. TaxID=239 RepID=UPI0031DBDEE5